MGPRGEAEPDANGKSGPQVSGEYAALCEKWKRRLDEANEANEPLKVTPEELAELRRMEALRNDSLTPEQRYREEFQSLIYGGNLAMLTGTPVVVIGRTDG